MSAPIGYTCKDINRVIQDLNWAQEEIETLRNNTEDKDLISTLENILEYLDFEDQLEDLRTANSTLREWGEALEVDISDNDVAHQNELDELQDKINDLEDRIDTKESIIKDLYDEINDLKQDIKDLEQKQHQ